ncbi:superoxide dismutase family protein [Lysobacter solisilvae (ex Woo and Kim 2020)]|uniref:Superoxide dismutase [Cu-Zn] n=1 Tax=Agrilutibacter terrestris TaxID=2865112 RepID=A0A7H0G0V5_9GAMM|nr:superoxide dismutase family protein [Lysobacter terrestris]QNP41921.1 superoxide dismutase family protein [Lysobacter terrestris]
MSTVLLRRSLAVAGLVGLAACSTTPSHTTARAGEAASTASGATVTLTPASGSLISGKLDIAPIAGGVRVSGEIGGLARGSTHAIHIHEKGDCSAADATSAGGHFNPAQQAHGRAGSGPHHGGDMDNIVADGNGVARVDVRALGVTLGGGATDIGGRAIVVHAAPDDYASQPAGNAGARVACGVIKLLP